MDSNEFFRIIEKEVNQKLANRLKPHEIDLIAYLAENKKDKISYDKLRLALSMISRDEPLIQAGTSNINEYQKDLRKKLNQNEGDKDTRENVVKNFLDYCVRHNYNF
jgi:methionine aminopeptidase